MSSMSWTPIHKAEAKKKKRHLFKIQIQGQYAESPPYGNFTATGHCSESAAVELLGLMDKVCGGLFDVEQVKKHSLWNKIFNPSEEEDPRDKYEQMARDILESYEHNLNCSLQAHIAEALRQFNVEEKG